MYKIEKSDIHGLGLIATQRISEGIDLGVTHIGAGIINGKVVCSDVTKDGLFTNHSYEPNCIYKVIGKDIHMVTIRDIEVGEELVIDYTGNKDIAINIEYEIKDNWR